MINTLKRLMISFKNLYEQMIEDLKKDGLSILSITLDMHSVILIVNERIFF